MANTHRPDPFCPPLAPFLPRLTDAEREAIDAAMHQDKQARPGNLLVDGYEARRQAKAISMELGSRRHS